LTSEYLNEAWEKHPDYVRRFYDNFELNKKLCDEVEYTLSTEIQKEEIEIAQITSRAKTLESFCEKISRKSYSNPFDEITDFSGVRVVYLYSIHKNQIEKIIEREFEVIEKVDKVLVDDNVFGYGALHYLIKIKNTHAGARYEELKNKVCEIQVRTILQDAWAVVAHHLSYKQESDVPKELREICECPFFSKENKIVPLTRHKSQANALTARERPYMSLSLFIHLSKDA